MGYTEELVVLAYQVINTVIQTFLDKIMSQAGESFGWPNSYKMSGNPFNHFSVKFIHPIISSYGETLQDAGNAAGTWLEDRGV